MGHLSELDNADRRKVRNTLYCGACKHQRKVSKDQHEEDVRINTQLVVVWNVKAPQGWVM